MSGTSGFASSFWSADYAAGLGVLFGKLQQGVQENQQVLTTARLRAEAEELYAQKLTEIGPATDRIGGGFFRDDGASTRKAFEGMRAEMEAAALSHRKIANNIRELVVTPFSRWCDQHALRIQNSQDDLQGRIKLHDRQAEQVRKFRSQYYNKCRQVEDLEEEDKLAFKEPAAASSPKQKPTPAPTIKVEEAEPDEPDYIELGDETYGPEQMKKILTHMLETIKLGETTIPILGTYQNTSTGSDITEYIQKHMNASSVSYAERIGQDMVTHGFLRLIGKIGGEFANSTKMKYQWRPKVFQITGIPESKRTLDRASSVLSDGSLDSPASAVTGYLAGWNPLNNPYPNETPSEKLRREAREADERYKAAVRKLDALRCNLEEAMMDHLKFMERCELDRLKAIKSVILDFSGAIGNVIPSLQSTVDSMMLFQETVQPSGDLRYLLENYRTGSFFPKVQIYENYYNSVDEQTFGIDLEARARSDRKRVPLVVTTILTFLDNHYPDLEGDEARRGIWLVDVPLAATHHLRSQINTGKPPQTEILEKYEIPIVASVLKLYLLELPDSLVSSHVYEIIKAIYTTGSSSSDETRVQVLQNTLGQLRLANIATLDALTTHFTRLIDLTSADEAYVSALATALAPCILRPKSETSLTMAEKFNYRLVRDLFAHKEAIFGELKRASLQHTASTSGTPEQRPRPRTISTDESNRRAHMEERQRAIAANRSRASSPAPSPRHAPSTHRRDKSVGGPETRFPIQTSPTDIRRPRGDTRNSLEVPGSLESSPVVHSTTTMDLPVTSRPNGQAIAGAAPNGGVGTDSPVDSGTPTSTGAPDVEKRNSINRRFARKPAGGLQRQSLVKNRDSVDGFPAEDPNRPVGVELVDKPMDD